MSDVGYVPEAEEEKPDCTTASLPVSFYQNQEMNRHGGEPRLERVPSQYQLESLSEPYVFDNPTFAPRLQPTPLESSLPPFVPSQYVSQQMP